MADVATGDGHFPLASEDGGIIITPLGISPSPCAPAELRPHFRAALAAARADEARFDVGESNNIGPAVSARLDVVAAAVVAAIDQPIADAGCAHLRRR